MMKSTYIIQSWGSSYYHFKYQHRTMFEIKDRTRLDREKTFINKSIYGINKSLDDQLRAYSTHRQGGDILCSNSMYRSCFNPYRS